MSAEDLIMSLRRLPTPEEHALADSVGLHDGSGIPFHMFAKVAVQAERNREWIGGVDDLVKKARRRALAAMGTVAINLTAFVGFLMHRASEDGATTERVVQVEQRAAERRDALEREIQDLRLDVRELRAAMRRMGLGPEPPSGDVFWPAPDKISVLKGPSCSVFTSPSR